MTSAIPTPYCTARQRRCTETSLTMRTGRCSMRQRMPTIRIYSMILKMKK
nr:MAG TPA: hypothetical protein [Herelleviridae sp.]